MNQGKRTPTATRVATGAEGTDLFHPDYTVGFGFSPNLLTLPVARQALAGSWKLHIPPVGNRTPP